jgi:hypothetical protein
MLVLHPDRGGSGDREDHPGTDTDRKILEGHANSARMCRSSASDESA